MSRTFHQKVTDEIHRREDARLKKLREEEQAKKEKTKEEVLKIFDKCLEERLQNFENYNGHKIRGYTVRYMSYSFSEVAKELGFELEYQQRMSRDEDDRYYLSIPAFEKGNKRTPAQLRLFKFEQKLSKARKERKANLLIECKRIKQLINEGAFEYSVIGPTIIRVASEEKVNTEFEVKVIKNFFSKLKLKFDGYSNGKWTFKL